MKKNNNKVRTHWIEYVINRTNLITKCLINKEFDKVDNIEEELLAEFKLYKEKLFKQEKDLTPEVQRQLNEFLNLTLNFHREAAYLKAAMFVNEQNNKDLNNTQQQDDTRN